MQNNIQEAKTRLSRLVDAALAGEDISITRAGKPCVRLASVARIRARPAWPKAMRG